MLRCKILFPWLVCVVISLVFSATCHATSITFWTTEVSPDRQVVIRYLADAFQLFNPDIEVRVEGVNENSMVDKLAAADADGSMPDMVGCASDLVVAFANNGWINGKAASEVISGIGKERFYAGAVNKLRRSDGCYCGIPFNGWVQGIWYRKDWFEAHGLEPPDTWTNIEKAARTLHDPSAGRYGILIGTRNDAYAEQVFTHLALSAGVREFSTQGDVVFDSPAAIETMAFYADLAKYTPPGPQTWRGRDFYFQDKLAMMFYSTFIMDDLAVSSIAADSLTGKNFEELTGAIFDFDLLDKTGMVAKISHIKGQPPAGYGVVHALGIMKAGDEEKLKAVKQFIRFLFREDAYVTWLHMVPGGMLPVLKDVAGGDVFHRDAQGVFQRYSHQRVNTIITGFDSLKSLSFEDGVLLARAAQVAADGVIGEMIDNVLNKGVPPAEAVSAAARRMRATGDRKGK